ncbi:uncharacterized protein LOC106168272 isoform X1 [Lingula anatina]|uniref:Uncharacterized protein LOC106168272 isoform X1 n=1 Tax=Lingula anatina TaxID=7574 RepID=A0A1S3IYV9_LINAN|nr:uncharacterized protein LOC106168272 isoform X1 [Lingula anatina]|eukprot:XP_013402734.1 uncharacterized protein LOC106168272 isoform X1 [Lingula anatina]
MKVVVCCLLVLSLQPIRRVACVRFTFFAPRSQGSFRNTGPVQVGGAASRFTSNTAQEDNTAFSGGDDLDEEGRFEGTAVRAVDAVPRVHVETKSRVRLVSYTKAVRIKYRYIVQLKEDLPESRVKSHLTSVRSSLKQRGPLIAKARSPLLALGQPKVDNVITIGRVKFYVMEASPEDMENIVRTKKADVTTVYEDTKVKLLDCKNITGWSWGLDRLDMRAVRDFRAERDRRLMVDGDGRDVDVYVLDTGIRADHREFRKNRGKIIHKVDPGMSDGDTHGHGTHVSGLIAGRSFGVARLAQVNAIKVVDDKGEGSASWLLSGLEHAVNTIKTKPNRKAVINISLGYPKSDLIDAAINETVRLYNIPVVVAAGNEAMDACEKSPSGASEAITVSATSYHDIRPKWANYGPCVDIFAPGNKIKSSMSSAWNAAATLSGTSMACPLVVGSLAAYLSSLPASQKPTPAELKDYLFKRATLNEIRNAGKGSPNRLLYVKCSSLQEPQTCNCMA